MAGSRCGICRILTFGELVFQFFALMQITLVLFFLVLFSQGNIAAEKDKRTLILLLMTDLRDAELVLGKLLASLLLPLLLVAISYPAWSSFRGWGGVETSQIVGVLVVSAAAGLAGRGQSDRFALKGATQTLSIALIGVVVFLAVIEAIGGLVPALGRGSSPEIRSESGAGDSRSLRGVTATEVALRCGGGLLTLAVGLIGATVWQLRVWNPSRAVTEARTLAMSETERTRTARSVWENPIVWREMIAPRPLRSQGRDHQAGAALYCR